MTQDTVNQISGDSIRWIDWVFLGGEIIAALWAIATFFAWLGRRPKIKIEYYCNTNNAVRDNEPLQSISITIKHLRGSPVAFEQAGIFMRVGGRIFRPHLHLKVSEDNQKEEFDWEIPVFDPDKPLLRRHVLGVELKTVKGKIYYSDDVPKNFRQSLYKKLRWKLKMLNNRLNGVG